MRGTIHLPAELRRRIEAAQSDPRPEAPTPKEAEVAWEWARSTSLTLPEATRLVQVLGATWAADLLEKLASGPPEAPETWWDRLKSLPIFQWCTYFQKNGSE